MTTIPLYIGSLARADTESLSAPLLRGRQGGWLSPNDCRISDDIRPPNTGAAAVAHDKPPADDAGKVACLDQHRAT